MRTEDEEKQKQLSEQKETIKGLDNSLKKFDEQERQLKELSKIQKEKAELNFNDKKKLESFLKRQKQQDDVMKNFNKKLKENFEEFEKNNQDEDAFREELKERLDENENQLKQDEKLLKELEQLQDKINKEEFSQKLDELAKQNKNRKKSLQQLLELTKRFYVSKKLEKLQEELAKDAIEQEKLSNEPNEENTKEKQDELNKKFQEFMDEMETLEKENKALKKPMEIPRDKLDENEIEKEQNNASEELEKQEENDGLENNEEEPNDTNIEKAKQSQKKAAKKMMNMSQKMQQSMQMSGGEQMQEDAEMLRQILDNLVLFSFDQESLLEQFQSIDINHDKYAGYLKKQNDLREHFRHIDDSLFALSLRQPKLSETVNKEITEVFFNTDKAIALLAENQLTQGMGHQQFIITAANNLSNFLSDVLDNMEEQLNMAQGKGKGEKEMQLQDIIMSQEELNKMMEEGIKGKEKEKSKDGENKKYGNEGENKKDGQQQLGNQNGNSDDENGMLFEIYQKQQELRKALEERMEKEGLKGNTQSLLRKMEDVEMDLLNKGFTNETLNKMMELEHQLLKLDNAELQQGEDTKRESKTAVDVGNGFSNNQIEKARKYFQTTEILNRNALPLKQNYKSKVQEYFKKE